MSTNFFFVNRIAVQLYEKYIYVAHVLFPMILC